MQWSSMASENSQAKVQPEQQNNLPAAQRSLSDSDIEELVRFFQMLDEWDRQDTAKRSVNVK